MTEKKGMAITNAFQTVLDESEHKANKIWGGKGRRFFNRSMKLWLQDNDIEMYSTHNNKGTSAVAGRFIRTLKNKIYKHMTSTSKNVPIDKLNDIVNDYNNTYHTNIKLKPTDVKSSTNFDFNVESNDKNPNFEVGNHEIISKYKNIFGNNYSRRKFKKLCCGHMLSVILTAKKMFKRLTKRNCKASKKELQTKQSLALKK